MMINKKMFGPLSEETTRVILECISDGVFTIDYNWEITSFNRAAEEITGISREEAIGRHCWEVFRSNMCEQDCALKKTMEEGRPFISTTTYIINNEKKRIPITASTSLLIDEQGEVIGGVETFRDHSLVEALKKKLSSRIEISDIISRSDVMTRILDILPQVAQSDSSVLIEGETGTGKELMAKAIHDLSTRKGKPFIAINCGALPDTLLESELFGYKKGAFTHAVTDKPGQFGLANGGTIFLDEIGDTSPAFQVSLLRVLQEHEFTPLGGIRKEKTDVRILAATNKTLSELIEENRFRQDLFYRINVVHLTLPPLRQRMEDIPFLVERFISKLNILKSKQIQGIDTEVLQAFMAYDFKGNIRELENIIEHAFVLCADGYIRREHLPDFLSGSDKTLDMGTRDLLTQAHIQMIMDALERNDFNRNAAAKDLGIHKSTLFRRIKKLGIQL